MSLVHNFFAFIYRRRAHAGVATAAAAVRNGGDCDFRRSGLSLPIEGCCSAVPLSLSPSHTHTHTISFSLFLPLVALLSGFPSSRRRRASVVRLHIETVVFSERRMNKVALGRVPNIETRERRLCWRYFT